MSEWSFTLPDHLLALKAAAFDPASRGEWGLIILALLSGFAARSMVRRLRAYPPPGPFPDLLQPLLSLALLMLGWRLWFHHAPALLLHVTAALLLALSAARIGATMVRSLMRSRGLALTWERYIVRVVWTVFALHELGLLDVIAELLNDLTLPIGDHSVSALRILNGGAVILAALVFSLWIGRVLEQRVMGIDTLDASLRVIFTKLLRGVLLTLAILVVLPLVGVDTTFLSVLGGALGVGLGFGLQKIASNYVSGFIILLDRSVRLNDVLTVDGRKGLVSHMEARYTVLKNADGTETIIPNETFVISTVINHTLNSRQGTVHFALWLAHDADVHGAIEGLQAMLRAQPTVLPAPGPSAQINQITDVGIELHVTWWIEDLSLADADFRPAMQLAALDLLRSLGIPLARRPDAVAGQRKDSLPA